MRTGEVLVAEDRHGLAGGRHPAGDGLHEVLAGVEVLVLLVPAVVAVLSDEQHAILRRCVVVGLVVVWGGEA